MEQLGADVTEIVGAAFTVIVMVSVSTHPLPLVPVTVYVVVVVGEIGTPSLAPLSHVYEVAPDPVKVTESPSQMVVAVALAVTVGKEFTVTVMVSVF